MNVTYIGTAADMTSGTVSEPETVFSPSAPGAGCTNRSITMAKYAYPAVFTKEDQGGYSITFHDLEGCYTCGQSIEEGLEMAEDVLALILYGYEADSRDIPEPSSSDKISLSENEFINWVRCDTMEYRKMHNNKAVKKTLTIPEWLNAEASARGVNFSAVLQEALKSELNMK